METAGTPEVIMEISAELTKEDDKSSQKIFAFGAKKKENEKKEPIKE